MRWLALLLIAATLSSCAAVPVVMRVHCVYKNGARACFTRADQPIAAGQEIEIVPY